MKSVRRFLLIGICFSLAGGFLIKQEKDAYAQGGIIGKLKGVLKKVEGKDKEGEKSSPGEDGSATKKEDKDKKIADKRGDEDGLDLPDGLNRKPDFILPEEEKEQLGLTTDEEGNTTTVYKTKDGAWIKETKDKNGKVKQTIERKEIDGIDTVKHVDHEKGVTTVTQTQPDGSKIQETRDNKTGETLSEVGISANGKLFTYKTGSDADKAFEEGEHISTTKYSSAKDWVKGEESGASEFRYKGQAELDELDRQLKTQMAGGSAVTGDDIIVSSNFKERSRSSRQESQNGESATSIEHLAMSSEVRAVNPDGQYGVKSAGEPVSAEGVGKTPSEALSNALNSAASTVATKIKSEFIDQMRSTRKTDGGAETLKAEDDISSTIDSSSFVVFDGYEVESVRTDEGCFVVKVKATPGVTVRK